MNNSPHLPKTLSELTKRKTSIVKEINENEELFKNCPNDKYLVQRLRNLWEEFYTIESKIEGMK